MTYQTVIRGYRGGVMLDFRQEVNNAKRERDFREQTHGQEVLTATHHYAETIAQDIKSRILQVVREVDTPAGTNYTGKLVWRGFPRPIVEKTPSKVKGLIFSVKTSHISLASESREFIQYLEDVLRRDGISFAGPFCSFRSSFRDGDGYDCVPLMGIHDPRLESNDLYYYLLDNFTTIKATEISDRFGLPLDLPKGDCCEVFIGGRRVRSSMSNPSGLKQLCVFLEFSYKSSM